LVILPCEHEWPNLKCTYVYLLCKDCCELHTPPYAPAEVFPTAHNLFITKYWTMYDFVYDMSVYALAEYTGPIPSKQTVMYKHNHLNLYTPGANNVAVCTLPSNSTNAINVPVLAYALLLASIVPTVVIQTNNTRVTIKPTNMWELNCFLADMLSQKLTNMVFLMDIETNTINPALKFTEPSNTEIIDRYVCEYYYGTCMSDGLIKNKHPLTTSHITGITDADMINADKSTSRFQNEMNYISKYCVQPKLVAHNGLKFDFPILQYHNIILKKQFELVDSITEIKKVFKCKSYSLINLYCLLIKQAVQSHRAKGDTLMLREIYFELNLMQPRK